MRPMFFVQYLQSLLLFACLLLLFLLLIWHHERGLGLLTGITDSGAFLFLFLVFLSLIFINIMASVASLSIYIYIYMHSINIFLPHCPWQIYQVISFHPLYYFPFFRRCVCVGVFGCLSLDASYFCLFLLSGW